MLLYALAVENLLKSIIIARGEDPAPEGQLANWFKHHNLRTHAKRADLSFPIDSDFLQKLRDFIECGKYPIGRDAKSGKGAKSLTLPDDINSVFDLLDSLEAELRDILPLKSLPETNLRAICTRSKDSDPEVKERSNPCT